MARKSPQEVAQENLETAERVNEKAQARVEKTREAYEKAQQDARLAARKVRAARMVALDEETDSIDTEPTPAGSASNDSGDDVL